MGDWKDCEHEWELSLRDSDYNSDSREEVVCEKCGCPGERYLKTGTVFWPAT